MAKVSDISFDEVFYDDNTCIDKTFNSSDLQLVIDRDNMQRKKYRQKLQEVLRFNRLRPSGDYKEHIQYKRWLFDMILKTGVMQFEFNMLRDVPDLL